MLSRNTSRFSGFPSSKKGEHMALIEQCDPTDEPQKISSKEKLLRRRKRLQQDLSETNEAIAVFEENPDAEDLCRLFLKTVHMY